MAGMRRKAKPRDQEIKCCLCLKKLETESDNSTRKRFHGATCENERAILFPILKKKHPRLDYSFISELNDPDVSLCATYSRLLKRARQLETDLNGCISNVLQYLSVHNSINKGLTTNRLQQSKKSHL